MVKKILCVILTMMMSITPVYSETLKVDAPYLYVYSYTHDHMIQGKNVNKKMYPASLTKMMTVLVAIENIEDFNKKVTIKTEYISKCFKEHASMAGLDENSKVTLEDCLYGTMLRSGAEAVYALCDAVAGSEKDFVKLMNQKAKELGLDHTHFKNATGLHHKDHYSTCYDMALLIKKALKNATFKKVYTAFEYKTTTGKMMNSLKKRYGKKGYDTSCIVGSKTGFTDEAAYCVGALIKAKDEQLIVIIGKDKSRGSYIKKLKKLSDYYQNHYGVRYVSYFSKKLGTVTTTGFFNHYTVYSSGFLKIYYDQDTKALKEVFEPEKNLPTVKKGDLIGYRCFYDRDHLIFKVPYYASYGMLVSYMIPVVVVLLVVLVLAIIALLIARKIYRMRRRRLRNMRR